MLYMTWQKKKDIMHACICDNNLTTEFLIFVFRLTLYNNTVTNFWEWLSISLESELKQSITVNDKNFVSVMVDNVICVIY